MANDRPRIDRSRVKERYAYACKSLPDFLDLKYADGLTSLISHAMDVAHCGVALDVDHEKIYESLRIAGQASAAVFTIAKSEKQSNRVKIDNVQQSRVEGRPARSTVHALRWVHGFFLNAICRQSDLLNELCAFPTDLLRQSSTVSPEYRYLLVDSLRAFWLNDSKCNKIILNGLEATDPERSDVLAKDWTLNIDVPVFQLLFYVAGKDSDFAENISKAALLHNGFWTSNKKRRDNLDGFLSVDLTGLAALAYDRKMAFAIDSMSIPNWLVTHNCR